MFSKMLDMNCNSCLNCRGNAPDMAKLQCKLIVKNLILSLLLCCRGIRNVLQKLCHQSADHQFIC